MYANDMPVCNVAAAKSLPANVSNVKFSLTTLTEKAQ